MLRRGWVAVSVRPVALCFPRVPAPCLARGALIGPGDIVGHLLLGSLLGHLIGRLGSFGGHQETRYPLRALLRTRRLHPPAGSATEPGGEWRVRAGLTAGVRTTGWR
jgi:hypothetical protein